VFLRHSESRPKFDSAAKTQPPPMKPNAPCGKGRPKLSPGGRVDSSVSVRMLKGGGSVRLEAVPGYEGGNQRPVGEEVFYTVNGYLLIQQ
jgi:hypothetical protein